MPAWLREAALVPASERGVGLVVVGGVLTVVGPQRALRAPLLQAAVVALLQGGPIGQQVVAVQVCQSQGTKAIDYSVNLG